MRPACFVREHDAHLRDVDLEAFSEPSWHHPLEMRASLLCSSSIRSRFSRRSESCDPLDSRRGPVGGSSASVQPPRGPRGGKQARRGKYVGTDRDSVFAARDGSSRWSAGASQGARSAPAYGSIGLAVTAEETRTRRHGTHPKEAVEHHRQVRRDGLAYRAQSSHRVLSVRSCVGKHSVELFHHATVPG